jgi:3-deoxy-D-manno-octulosonic-acid transferase
MLKIYQTLTIILSPLIRFYLIRRRWRGKEDLTRFNERIGISKLQRPNGRLVWVHAASVGESISVLPLIKLLGEKYQDVNFLITSGTVTSAKLVENNMPNRAIHQYVPVDVLPYVKRFLKCWQPNLAIFVESEIWPNLITQTAKYCSLIMVNGHISSKSFNSWNKNKELARDVFSMFSLCLTQSQVDLQRLVALGAKNVKCVGNIKYDSPAQTADPTKMAEISAQIGNRTLWVAASTHKEDDTCEEKIVAITHIELKEKHPDILTIIVPRHPSRKDEILAELLPLGLNIAVRSHGDVIDNNTDIYLADTLGELGLFYRLAKIVFVGGSLVKRGGHNPLEPARLECAIIVGVYTFNFMEIMQEFNEKNAALVVSSQQDLVIAINNLLADQQKISQLANSALKLVSEKTGIINKVIEEISPHMENNNAA